MVPMVRVLPAAFFSPLPVWHHDIQDYQVRRLLLDQPDGIQSVAAGNDLVPLILQVETDTLDQQRFIVYDQYFHRLSSDRDQIQDLFHSLFADTLHPLQFLWTGKALMLLPVS